MKLDRTEIVASALDLLNEAGLEGLSTRALAARVGVQQPALYWHFRSKRALIDAMNAEILRSSHLYRIARPGDGWRSFLVATSLSFRSALLSFRDGARVHAGSHAEASDMAAAEAQLRFLINEGFDRRSALRVLVTLSRFTVGFVLEEQAERDHPPMNPSNDCVAFPLLADAFDDYVGSSQDDLFREALTAFLDGISRARISETGREDDG